MNAFLITLAIFAIALLAMSVGVLVSNRRIKGSCGGLAGFRDSEGRPVCDACSNPSPDCRGEPLEDEAPEESTTA